jgi:methionyl-tRNA synthetase
VALNNSALAGNLGNLATRVLKFIEKNFDNRVPPLAPEHRAALDAAILEGSGPIGDPAGPVREFRFRRAAEVLLANASVANVFMQNAEPWALRKTDPERAASALNTLCEWLSWMARWMAPFLPNKAQELWEMLGLPGRVADQPWPAIPQAATWRTLPAGAPLGRPAALFPRLEPPGAG